MRATNLILVPHSRCDFVPSVKRVAYIDAVTYDDECPKRLLTAGSHYAAWRCLPCECRSVCRLMPGGSFRRRHRADTADEILFGRRKEPSGAANIQITCIIGSERSPKPLLLLLVHF